MPMASRRWLVPALGIAGAVCLAAVALLDRGAASSAFALFAVALLAVSSVGALAGSRFLAQRLLGICAVGAGLAIGSLILQTPLLAQADGLPPIHGADGPMLLAATLAGVAICGWAALLARRTRTRKAWPWDDGVA